MFAKRFKEWLTRTLGLVIMLGAGYLLYLGKITVNEFMFIMPSAVGLIWAKNSFITDIFKSGKGGAAAILVLLMLLTGCRANRPAIAPQITTSSSSTTTADSGMHQQGFIKPDSASIRALLKCDSLGNVHLEYIAELLLGKNVKPEIQIKDNYISLKCKVDSAEVWNKWSRFHQATADTTSKVEYLPGTVTNELTWFQKLMIKLGWAFMAAAGAFGIYIYLRIKK